MLQFAFPPEFLVTVGISRSARDKLGYKLVHSHAVQAQTSRKNTQSPKSPISPNGRPANKASTARTNEYGIPDWRLENPDFEVVEVSQGTEVHYEIRGKLNTPAPPIRESKHLNQQQCLELYRWMLLNRRM